MCVCVTSNWFDLNWCKLLFWISECLWKEPCVCATAIRCAGIRTPHTLSHLCTEVQNIMLQWYKHSHRSLNKGLNRLSLIGCSKTFTVSLEKGSAPANLPTVHPIFIHLGQYIITHWFNPQKSIQPSLQFSLSFKDPK